MHKGRFDLLSWVFRKQGGSWSEIWVPILPHINSEALSSLLNVFEFQLSYPENRVVMHTYKIHRMTVRKYTLSSSHFAHSYY